MGLFWASKYCSEVDFVLKVNDDVWVNSARFLDYFESNVHQNHFFGGKCVMGQPDRNRNSPRKNLAIYPRIFTLFALTGAFPIVGIDCLLAASNLAQI